MLAFRAHGKAAESAGAANRRETLFAASQKLMDVHLVAHVPNKFIFGRAKNAVQRQRQFDDAKIGAKVATVFGEGSNEFLPDFLSKFMQLGQRQFFDMDRAVHHLEISAHIMKWRVGVRSNRVLEAILEGS